MSNQEQPSVYAITSASTGLSFDQAGRKRRYLISMSLRTICFVGAVFTSGNLRWALIFGAIFLPYIAVVIANADERISSITANKWNHQQEKLNQAQLNNLGSSSLTSGSCLKI